MNFVNSHKQKQDIGSGTNKHREGVKRSYYLAPLDKDKHSELKDESFHNIYDMHHLTLHYEPSSRLVASDVLTDLRHLQLINCWVFRRHSSGAYP